MIERFEQFTSAITSIYKNLQKVKSQEMSDLELRATHVMCLFQLNRHQKGLTVTQLSQLCAEDKAAISRTVSELVQKQLATTDTEKKYRAPIILTMEGISIAQHIDSMAVQAVQAVGQGLTQEEREIFYKVLFKIEENLRAYAND